MMNYEEACSTFDVKHTRRQRRKWGNQQGRAYRLASGLENTIRLNGARNATASRENDLREIWNGNLDEQEKPKEMLTLSPNFTDADVRRVLGQ